MKARMHWWRCGNTKSMTFITLKLIVGQAYLNQYGEAKYKALLYDIIERYGNEIYFEPNLLELDKDEFVDDGKCPVMHS